MKRRIHWALLGLMAVFPASVSWGHHTSGGGGGGLEFMDPMAAVLRPPRTTLSYSLTVDSLDEGRGTVLQNIFSAEYAVIPRFSLGLRVPFMSIRQSSRPPADGIGDIALLMKGRLWQGRSPRNSLTLGQGISFPTGDATNSLGEGNVEFFPFLNGTAGLGPIDLIAAFGGTLPATSDPDTDLVYSLGIQIPVSRGTLPVNFLVSFQGITFLQSDVFAGGSSKAWVVPAFVFFVRKNLPMSIAGKFSVLDTLGLRQGVVLNPTSTDLLSDVRFGVNFNMNYFFN